MDSSLYDTLKEKAQPFYSSDDPSHDFLHIERVLNNALDIAKVEGGDLDIIVAAAFFHDCVNYPKNHPKSDQSAQESANKAEEALLSIERYPKEKIPHVKTAIAEHSFSLGIKPDLLEAKIIQDSDRLEATGVISTMRTFSSTGQMKRAFYNEKDTFCETREPNPKQYGFDLFYKRLLVVKDMMNTETAKKMAEQRHTFLLNFIDQLKTEIPDHNKIKEKLQ